MTSFFNSINGFWKNRIEDQSEIQPIFQTDIPTFTLILTFYGCSENKYLVFEGPIDLFFEQNQNLSFAKRHPKKNGYYLLRTIYYFNNSCGYSFFNHQKYQLTLIQKHNQIILKHLSPLNNINH
jgi:hypothetical protein